MNPVAAEWLAALQSRGVTVSVRKNRLCLDPGSAYRDLSDDELLVLRHHRDAIKALVSGDPQPASPQPSLTVPASARPLAMLQDYTGDTITLDQWHVREDHIKRERERQRQHQIPDSAIKAGTHPWPIVPEGE